MWAKRFPVPEFDRHELKNRDWRPPAVQAGFSGAAAEMVAIDAGKDFYDRFSFQGEHLVAIACQFPAGASVTASGNSFAWPIQRAMIADSLDAATCNVIADWITPRPMNTRLGPDSGVSIECAEAYVLLGHRVADYWVSNRIALDSEWPGPSGNGFRILSSSEDQIDDFHDAVVYFNW